MRKERKPRSRKQPDIWSWFYFFAFCFLLLDFFSSLVRCIGIEISTEERSDSSLSFFEIPCACRRRHRAPSYHSHRIRQNDSNVTSFDKASLNIGIFSIYFGFILAMFDAHFVDAESLMLMRDGKGEGKPAWAYTWFLFNFCSPPSLSPSLPPLLFFVSFLFFCVLS